MKDYSENIVYMERERGCTHMGGRGGEGISGGAG